MLTSGFQVFKSVIRLLWIRFKIRLQDFYFRTKPHASPTLYPNGFHSQITELQSAGFHVYPAPIGYQRLVDIMEKLKEMINRTQQLLGLATIYVGDNLLWIQGPYENQFHYYKLPPPLWI
jgi:hypothetical protein